MNCPDADSIGLGDSRQELAVAVPVKCSAQSILSELLPSQRVLKIIWCTNPCVFVRTAKLEIPAD